MCFGHMPIEDLVRKHRFTLLSSNVQCSVYVSQSQLERNKRNHNSIKAAIFSKIHSLTLSSASCKCFDVRTMDKAGARARTYEANLQTTTFRAQFLWIYLNDTIGVHLACFGIFIENFVSTIRPSI